MRTSERLDLRVTIPVSVVVLTKNEETALPACLGRLKQFSEVFVIDSLSTDRTCEIARSFGATVVPFIWDGKYPKKKQWSLENAPATNEYILLLDADELVTTDLIAELNSLDLPNSTITAADVPLRYQFAGKFLSHGHKVRKRILLRKGRVQFPVIDDLSVTNMWEVEGHYQPLADGRTVVLKSKLEHCDPDTLYDYFARHNRYSDWEAFLEANPTVMDAVARSRTKNGRWFSRSRAKPLFFFLYSFLLRQGFRDGRAGFDYALAQAFYYWQISLKARDLRSEVLRPLERLS